MQSVKNEVVQKDQDLFGNLSNQIFSRSSTVQSVKKEVVQKDQDLFRISGRKN